MREAGKERSFFMSLFILSPLVLPRCLSFVSLFFSANFANVRLRPLSFSPHHSSSTPLPPSPPSSHLPLSLSSSHPSCSISPLSLTTLPLPLLFPFLSRREMCSSLVCSPHRLTSVCPSHLAALLRSHLRCCVTPPPPPANLTTTSLHMVSSSFCSSTRKRHPGPSEPPHTPPPPSLNTL